MISNLIYKKKRHKMGTNNIHWTYTRITTTKPWSQNYGFEIIPQ